MLEFCHDTLVGVLDNGPEHFLEEEGADVNEELADLAPLPSIAIMVDKLRDLTEKSTIPHTYETVRMPKDWLADTADHRMDVTSWRTVTVSRDGTQNIQEGRAISYTELALTADGEHDVMVDTGRKLVLLAGQPPRLVITTRPSIPLPSAYNSGVGSNPDLRTNSVKTAVSGDVRRFLALLPPLADLTG